jgi:hypothetical protein
MNDSPERISPLRRRMIEDMRMRKLSTKTQSAYIRAVRHFAGYLGRSPDTALDMFVPQLLSATDHQIVVKPQTGIRQYGVDIVSRGPTEDGRTALHIWVLKCGDIDRDVWGVGRQSIRHSLEEIADVYLRSHVLPEDKALPKIVWVLAYLPHG